MSKYLSILLFIFLLQTILDEAKAWDYQHVQDWVNVSSLCGTGKHQSPIDLHATAKHTATFLATAKNTGKPSIEVLNYDAVQEQVILHNTEKFVEMNNTWWDKKPSIKSSTLFPNETFILDNAYFHWGYDNNNGTEHAIEGKKYAVELHLFHHSDKYANLSEALDHSGGTLILAILLQVNNSAPANPGMLQLSTYLEDILSPRDYRYIDKFDSSSFLPKPIGSYYFYNGSLTVPLCNEGVRFIVLADPQPINSDIKELFRNVGLNKNDNPCTRPLQSVNDRAVEFYEE